MGSRKSVLFVCMGNICRSPTGEGVFREFLRRSGRDGEFEIDSAGTISYHVGEPPDRRMQAAAAKRGYTLHGRSRQVHPRDLGSYDLIVAMDRENLADLQRLDREGAYRTRIRLLTDFHPSPPGPDVPDPYYGGSRGFDDVLDLIEQACPNLLRFLDNGDAM